MDVMGEESRREMHEQREDWSLERRRAIGEEVIGKEGDGRRKGVNGKERSSEGKK